MHTDTRKTVIEGTVLIRFFAGLAGMVLTVSAWAQSVPTIIFEAEAASRVDGVFERWADTTCSGGAVLRVRDGKGNAYDAAQSREMQQKFPDTVFSNNPGAADYRIRLERGGLYTLWARAYWFGPCGNSFWITPPGVAAHQLGDEIYKRWHWVKAEAALRLPPGVLQLQIRSREDGVRIDQFCLTADASFRPAGRMQPNARFVYADGITMSITASVPVVLAGTSTPGSVWVRSNSPERRALAITAESDEALQVQLTGKARLELEADSGPVGIPFEVKAVKHQALRTSDVRFVVSWQGEQTAADMSFRHLPQWEVTRLPAGSFASAWRLSSSRAPALQDLGSCTWHAVADVKYLRPSGRIDFQRFFPDTSHCRALARTEFDWDADEIVELVVRSDDWSRLWVNGELACVYDVIGPSDRYHRIVAVKLKEGKNTVLFLVGQQNGFWDAGLELQ